MNYYDENGIVTVTCSEETKLKLVQLILREMKFPKYKHIEFRSILMENACVLINQVSIQVESGEDVNIEKTNDERWNIVVDMFDEFLYAESLIPEFKMFVWDTVCVCQYEAQNISDNLPHDEFSIVDTGKGYKFMVSDWRGDCSKIGERVMFDTAKNWVDENCNEVNLGGYNDWRVPNKFEMSCMCSNKDTYELNGINALLDEAYWTSSELKIEELKKKYTHHAYLHYPYENKSVMDEMEHTKYVRAIRNV